MIDLDKIIEFFSDQNAEALDKIINEILIKIERKEINLKQHPLGFFYLKVIENPSKAIRLHLWLKGSILQSNHLAIHSHDFNLISYVYFGKIINTTYEISITEALPGYELFQVAYDTKNSYLIKTGKYARIKNKQKKVIKAGEFYSVLMPFFHKSNIGSEDYAITLAITTRPEENIAPFVVSTKKTNENNISFERRQINPEDEENLVRIIAGRKV